MRSALAICAALAVLTAATQAEAKRPRPLTNGWTLHPLNLVSTRSSVACGLDKAALLSWGGKIAVFDGSRIAELPAMTGHNQGGTYGDGLAISRSGEDIYAEASGRIAHWDGSDWSFITMPGWHGPVGGMAVLASGELVVVGRGRVGLRQGDEIVSYDAGTWRDLSAVTGTSLTDLWTAGQGGTVMHRQPGGWSRLATGFDRWVRGIHVGSPTAVWAWGSQDPWGNATYVMRLHGGRWAAASDGLPGDGMVTGMAGPADRPWAAVGEVIARFDGTRWVTELQGSDLGPDYQSFRGLCATGRCLFAGSSGRAPGAVVRKLQP